MEQPGSEKVRCNMISMNSCRVLRVEVGGHLSPSTSPACMLKSADASCASCRASNTASPPAAAMDGYHLNIRRNIDMKIAIATESNGRVVKKLIRIEISTS